MKKTFILFGLMLLLAACNPTVSQEAVEKILHEQLGVPTSIEISAPELEGDFYKVTLKSEGQEQALYLTKDLKRVITQMIDLDEMKKEQEAAQKAQQIAAEQAAAELTKSNKPQVELFVMSHCPYGTQIEKGILPVLDLLGDKIDFELKFCDYAMHGEVELTEQLVQYCVQKNQPEKLQAYLGCFLRAGEGAQCVTEVALDAAQLATCIDTTDQEYQVMANFADQSTWKGSYPTFNVYAEDNAKYGIQGSPSLVINGKNVNASRSSQSLLDLICAGFENAPEECSTELETAVPAPGFGFDGTGAATDASCG
ncbi:MAG: hypothetical protein PHU71_05295 [Candidatus Gracilibacteria bacterium]|nr:hypothetical protein [Candidatus Gracilibacteria bacterium]